MMRNIFFWFLVFLGTSIYCQTNGISYQVAILDPSGNEPLVNQTICLQFKIKNSSSLIDYQETITTSTDDFGMVNTIIGSGISSGGLAATFNDIVWDATSKRLIVEIDLNATCSSFIEISNQPFTSVPYALYATNGGSTNLSYTASATDGIVVSNTGDDAIIPLASETTAGLISPTEFSQLSNLTSSFAQKQDVLVDTVNIKTINGNSILGTGDLVVDGKVSQTITSEVTTSAPSEDAVFQALDLKINKNTLQTTAEHTPLNLFKITPFTPGNETFGIDFNSYPNSGPGAGTFNHGTWIGYNTGWHSEAPRTPGKPSIMIGLEDNYFDNDYDNDFGTEFYVQGFSPNGTSVRMSRPYYARGFQKDDGTDSWQILSNIGSSGTNRMFRVSAGVDIALMTLTPTLNTIYTDMNLYNSSPDTVKSFNFEGNQTGLGSLGMITWSNSQWGTVVKASISARTDISINDASLRFSTSPANVASIERMAIKANGNIIINTSIDNEVDKLQINGTVSGSPATLSNQFVIKDQLDTKQNTLINPVTGTGTANTIPKFTGSSTTANSIITDNGALVDIRGGGGATIDTRLSVSGMGNGGTGRGTAILMNVPGSSNSVNGVKINAYTTGGTTVDQSVDLAFDLASSGILEEKVRIKANGNFLLGTTTDDTINKLQVAGTVVASQYKLSALNIAPTSASAPGTVGEIRYDADYMYVCVATNTWKRSPLATW